MTSDMSPEFIDREPPFDPWQDTVTALPGNDPVTGNPNVDPDVTHYPPYVSVTGKALYADIATLLAEGFPPLPAPAVLNANDGVAMFYAGQVNLLFGDPESGKTWVALAAAAESLRTGKTAAVIDLDHNGVEPVVSRLLDLGATEEALTSLDRFRYAEPSDAEELIHVVRDLSDWAPEVVVLDSLGEVVPLFRMSSNSPDDFTQINSMVLKPLAVSGSCVVVIDHLAKNSESRAMGSTGTAAKKRAIGGVSIRVTIADQFTPGRGGACSLTIHKDRHGGLRAHRPTGDREPLAGTFRLFGDDDDRAFDLFAPADGQRNPTEEADPELVKRLRNMDPAPTSVAAARKALNCRMEAASKAFKEFKKEVEKRTLPPYPHIGGVTGNATEEHEGLIP